MIFEITEEMESKSRYGSFNNPTRFWYWSEYYLNTKELTGNIGRLRAITEMESLDRLREAFPDIGAIKWISLDRYLMLQREPQL